MCGFAVPCIHLRFSHIIIFYMGVWIIQTANQINENVIDKKYSLDDCVNIINITYIY